MFVAIRTILIADLVMSLDNVIGVAAAAKGKGRVLELSLQSGVSTRGHLERVERVVGHVVQNAFDATPVEGSVRLTLDESMTIVAAEAATDTGPYGGCYGAGKAWQALVGMRIKPGFLREANARMAGPARFA